MTMKTLYLIAGKTGAGKDTITDRLCEELGYKKVVSYTDAPIRSDQAEGREHYFLSKKGFDKVMQEKTVIAYVKIGNNRYMATLEQLDDQTKFYIIDPEGIKNLKENFGEKLDLRIIYLTVPDEIRRQRTSSRQGFDFDKRTDAENKLFEEFDAGYGWDLKVENKDIKKTVDVIKTAIAKFEAGETVNKYAA